MFEKKVNVKEAPKQGKKEKKEKRQVKAPGIVKIVLVPLLITVVLVAAIYLVMDKMTERETLLKNVVVASQNIRVNAYITPDEVEQYFDVIQVDGNAVAENAYTSLKDLKEKGYEPQVYRMFNFSSHYRKKINFTFEAMDAAKTALARLREGYLKHKEGSEDFENSKITEYKQKFLEAINDDLNMPVAMSVVWDVIKNSTKSPKLAELILDFDRVLGFDLKNYVPESNELPQEVLTLIEQRNTARLNKQWDESDRIRDVLTSMGYTVKDSKEGTIVEKN